MRKRKIHLKGGDIGCFLSGPRPMSAPVADKLCINTRQLKKRELRSDFTGNPRTDEPPALNVIGVVGRF